MSFDEAKRQLQELIDTAENKGPFKELEKVYEDLSKAAKEFVGINGEKGVQELAKALNDIDVNDAAQVQKIYVEPFPNYGLGLAMNDRLLRAAAKFHQ